MEDNSRPSQCKDLLSYLVRGNSITSIKALSELGIARLASRITELKHMGVLIGKRNYTGIARNGRKYTATEYCWMGKRELVEFVTTDDDDKTVFRPDKDAELSTSIIRENWRMLNEEGCIRVS